MTVQLDAPATLNSRFPLHKSHNVRGLRFFVVAHFNNISLIFRDWFRRMKTNRLPPPSCYLTNHCSLNTALSTVRAVQNDSQLQLYRELEAAKIVCTL